MPKNKPPEVIIEFEPNSTFREEFIEFIEQVLSWAEEKSTNKSKNNKDANKRRDNPKP